MQLNCSNHFTRTFQVGGLYFSLNMFLPLLGLTFLLGMDLAKGNLTESTLELLTSMMLYLGASFIFLLVVFLLLINREVSPILFKLLRIKVSNTIPNAQTLGQFV